MGDVGVRTHFKVAYRFPASVLTATRNQAGRVEFLDSTVWSKPLFVPTEPLGTVALHSDEWPEFLVPDASLNGSTLRRRWWQRLTLSWADGTEGGEDFMDISSYFCQDSS